MARIKTQKEIELMRQGGAILSRALACSVLSVRPGVMLRTLDDAAEAAMREEGAEPSFKGYRVRKDDLPFPSTVCLSVNDEIVHGSGKRDVELKEGDVVGLDIGCWYKGLCTDMAVTVGVGTISKDAEVLIRVTRAACLAAVETLKPGAKLGDVGKAVERIIEPYGFGNVRALGGHGVGHAVHEDPHILNYYTPISDRTVIEEGMCLAIEPMLTLGTSNVETGEDGWSVLVADGSLGAHFEVSTAIGPHGAEILTPWPEGI